MRTHVKVGLALGLLLGVALTLALPGWAGRNSGGSYTLPAGNPVVPGTPISSSWANSTLADIGTELTNSLDRQGRGGMQAPLRGLDGTPAAPAFSFVSDTNTGFYRVAADNPALAVGGTLRQEWTTTGSTVAGLLGTTGGVSSVATIPAAGSVFSAVQNFELSTMGTTVGADFPLACFKTTRGPNVLALCVRAKNTGPTSAAFGISYDADGSIGNGRQLWLADDGVRLGNSGSTGISGSYGASYSIDFPNVANTLCANSPQALSGVAVGGVCNVSVDAALAVPLIFSCAVTGPNAVAVVVCNSTGGNQDMPATNFRVRVFQP